MNDGPLRNSAAATDPIAVAPPFHDEWGADIRGAEMDMSSTDFAGLHALCSNLIGRFYRGVDMGDDDAAASAFGDDGTWLRQGVVLTGADAVRTALHARTPGRRTCHSASNIVIEPTPDGALEVRYHVTVWVEEPGAAASVAAILDCDDVVEIEGTQARFRAKRSTIHMKFA